MDFESLLGMILVLVEFVKPVGGLVASFFQGLFANIVVFHALFYIAISFVLIAIFVSIFTDLSSK